MAVRAHLRLLVLLLSIASFPAAQTQPPPRFDPLKAEKNIEVGRFHLKRKNYDAAIERFREAIELRPGYVIPYKYLGEAYEKKKEWPAAIENYQTYLDLLPGAPDTEKIRRRIERCKQKMEKESREQARRKAGLS